jgi:hypothetical protein
LSTRIPIPIALIVDQGRDTKSIDERRVFIIEKKADGSESIVAEYSSHREALVMASAMAYHRDLPLFDRIEVQQQPLHQCVWSRVRFSSGSVRIVRCICSGRIGGRP